MWYRAGVLINNHHEDRAGADLLKMPKQPSPPLSSVSHAVHSWKEASRDPPIETAATQHVERHLFFGHSGDMSDPNVSMQKTEFMTNVQYFMRDPAKAGAGTGALTADKFASGEPDEDLAPHKSYLADRKRAGWGNGGQTHALQPADRFKTTNAADLQGDYLQKMGPAESRHARIKADVTGHMDKVQISRTVGRSRPLQGASAAALKR